MKTIRILAITLLGALTINHAMATSGSVRFTGKFIDTEPCEFNFGSGRFGEGAEEARRCLGNHHGYSMNVTTPGSAPQPFAQWLGQSPESGLYQINIRYY